MDKLNDSKMTNLQIMTLYKQASQLNPTLRVYEAGIVADLIKRIIFLEDGEFIDIPDQTTYKPIWLDAFQDSWGGRR